MAVCRERKKGATLKISLSGGKTAEMCAMMRRDEWRQTKRRNLKGGGEELTGCHLWKKPSTLTIHMCSDESPAKEKK